MDWLHDFIRILCNLGCVIWTYAAFGQLLSKQRTRATWLSSGFYLSVAMLLLSSWNTNNNLTYVVPQISLWDLPTFYLIGPCFLLITYEYSGDQWPKFWPVLFFPAIVQLGIGIPYYLLPSYAKVDRLVQIQQGEPLLLAELFFEFGVFLFALEFSWAIWRIRNLFRPEILRNKEHARYLLAVVFFTVPAILFSLYGVIAFDYFYFRITAGFIAVGVISSHLISYRYPQAAKQMIEQALIQNREGKFNPLARYNLKKLTDKLNDLFNLQKIHLNENLSPSDLCEAMKITGHDLSYFFNHYLGSSFSQYIQERRVEEAKGLLLHSDSHKSVLDIGFEAGFNSKASFNRVFKDITGLTPSEYRIRNYQYNGSTSVKQNSKRLDDLDRFSELEDEPMDSVRKIP